MSDPQWHIGETNYAFAHVLCAIDRFNWYFIDITVDNLEQLFGVVAFCQNILQYQPESDELDYIIVPPHLLNHWCVSQQLRIQNANRFII
jgi:hypothetical protein